MPCVYLKAEVEAEAEAEAYDLEPGRFGLHLAWHMGGGVVMGSGLEADKQPCEVVCGMPLAASLLLCLLCAPWFRDHCGVCAARGASALPSHSGHAGWDLA